MADNDDNACIARFQAGDVAAMNELIERYERKLHGYIRRMVASAADADDVYQEAWIRVMTRIDEYKPDHFGAWLFTITRNMIIDRGRGRRDVTSLDDPGGDGGFAPVERLAAPGVDPASQVSSRELGQAIETALESLPREQREVFVMRTQAGLAFKDIAKVQSVSINTALARMQYALDKLREMLKDEYRPAGMSE